MLGQQRVFLLPSTQLSFRQNIFFSIDSKLTFDLQTWYFGLSFTDSRNQPAWLIKSKKIVKQDLKKESVKKFQFKFKYFPENVADEVIQDNTMRMLYKQVCEHCHKKCWGCILLRPSSPNENVPPSAYVHRACTTYGLRAKYNPQMPERPLILFIRFVSFVKTPCKCALSHFLSRHEIWVVHPWFTVSTNST